MSIVEMIERLGALVLDGILQLGKFVVFLLGAVFYVFIPPFKPRLWIRQIRIIGADSLFLIILIGFSTGMVLGLQGYNTLRRFGSQGALGTVVALVLVREMGPVLTALMIAARAGLQLLSRHRAEPHRARHHDRHLQVVAVRRRGDLGLLLQGLSRGADG